MAVLGSEWLAVHLERDQRLGRQRLGEWGRDAKLEVFALFLDVVVRGERRMEFASA